MIFFRAFTRSTCRWYLWVQIRHRCVTVMVPRRTRAETTLPWRPYVPWANSAWTAWRILRVQKTSPLKAPRTCTSLTKSRTTWSTVRSTSNRRPIFLILLAESRAIWIVFLFYLNETNKKQLRHRSRKDSTDVGRLLAVQIVDVIDPSPFLFVKITATEEKALSRMFATCY